MKIQDTGRRRLYIHAKATLEYVKDAEIENMYLRADLRAVNGIFVIKMVTIFAPSNSRIPIPAVSTEILEIARKSVIE